MKKFKKYLNLLILKLILTLIIKKSPQSFVSAHHYNPHRHVFYITTIIFYLLNLFYHKYISCHFLLFVIRGFTIMNIFMHSQLLVYNCHRINNWVSIKKMFVAFTKYCHIAFPVAVPIFSGTTKNGVMLLIGVLLLSLLKCLWLY